MRIIFSICAIILGSYSLCLANNPESVGATTCMACHQTQVEQFKKSTHGKSFPLSKSVSFEQSCEYCHGPGSEHVAAAGDKTQPGYATIKNISKLAASESSQLCLQCHNNSHTQSWRGSAHESNNLSCISCHSIHSFKGEPLLKKANIMETCAECHKMQTAKQFKSSHMPVREGKIQCTTCHNPHGTSGNKMLAQNSVNENCYSCHAEKRGPFLWEHPPVRENCLNCHEAHGSQHDKLLKTKRPRLCQECHIEARHPTTGSSPDSIRIAGRSCVECHQMVHGSNHPAGARLTR